MKHILLSLLALAACNTAFAAKESVYTKNAPEPIGVYSQAIKMGNMVYISGQIPLNPKTGQIVDGTFKDQARQALANVKAVVQAAGGQLDDIVKVTVYLTDLSNFAAVNEVMLEAFHTPYPARAAIEIKALPKNATVEIEAMMQMDNADANKITTAK
jgi:2-iminobutanoate/2-iminopropanoate deaminase